MTRHRFAIIGILAAALSLVLAGLAAPSHAHAVADLHASPKGGGKETSYKKGRDVAADSGTLMAMYDGSRGWFWRNRGTKNVTVTLKTTGACSEIKRMN